MGKGKQHSDADRLRYIHMLETGRSIKSISKEFGINNKLLSGLWQKYQKYGAEAVKKSKYLYVEPAKKKQIVHDIEKNHITLLAASLKYGPSIGVIQGWLRIARRDGIDALDKIRGRGGLPYMGRPKKNSKPLTEVERLQQEILELKVENALLKKVKALVEEREARLRGTGQKPSKN